MPRKPVVPDADADTNARQNDHPDAALESGRLTAALEYSGFGDLPLAVPMRPPVDESKRTAAELTKARADADRTAKDREEARSQLADAEARISELAGELRRLQAELDQAGRDELAAERAGAMARKNLENADRLAETAKSRLTALGES